MGSNTVAWLTRHARCAPRTAGRVRLEEYTKPYDAVAEIKDHIAFYPDRVDSIEITD